jgi:hypothetical protein
VRGDVILFKKTNNPVDWAIATGTGGPYVHTEIDLGNGQLIGAHFTGIVLYNGVPAPDNTSRFSPPASPQDLEYGLAWAIQQVGKQYGWSDIASNVLKLCGLRIEFSEPGHWDCSDFVTRYLTVARAASPLGKLSEDPGLVSPNDLARAFNVR